MDQHVEIGPIIDAVAALLPPQGPINAFVALNPLRGFEHLRFEEAVVRASRIYKAQPFLPESAYRESLANGRIRVADIDAVLAEDLGEQESLPIAGGLCTLGQLHRLLLLHPIRLENDTAVRWTLTEGDVFDRLRPDISPEARVRLLAGVEGEPDPAEAERVAASELWEACVTAIGGTRASVLHAQPPRRYRDLIMAVAPTIDTDELVHPLLIKIVASFLDQGVASWAMPDRERGLLAAAAAVYESPWGPVDGWARTLADRFRSIGVEFAAGGDPRGVALDVIRRELRAMGVPPSAWKEYVTESVLALRGWAAMVRQLEERPDRAPVIAVPARLIDFVALRLLLDRAAVEWAARELGYSGDAPAVNESRLADLWVELRDRHPPRRGPGSVARSFLLFQVCQLLGLSAEEVRDLQDNDVRQLENGIAAFDEISRRRLFHLAYERQYRVGVLDALLAARGTAAEGFDEAPRAQAVFCIDDRCESFRRALEEIAADLETYGTAGFFAVPMYFQGIDDWHAVPLCPIVMRPGHTVVERPLDHATADFQARRALRRSWGRLRGGITDGSRTLFPGSLLTSVVGALAAVPLVARVAFPHLTAAFTARAADLANRRVPTRLEVVRTEARSLPDGTHSGFTVEEMAAIVRRLLEDIGLTAGFARIVAIVGHGSTSLNNPHESAYDCGACGGGRGGPNARAFALMANNAEVRSILAREGLVVPDTVVFVGGMLDTCKSEVTWFDVDAVPPSHRADFEKFRRLCSIAGSLDAQERCRRFDAIPLGVSTTEAVRSVESRAADLAQVRPEYGHATNALCVVGRRKMTRGVFLDRRSFLVSYDPDSDPDGRILERTLAAVGPVCGGISLAYLFSRVDPLGFGAGTKLPHNITGLIGVMDGHRSDLRTGLPFQGVDIHEPVRLLMVVEAPVERITAVLERLPAVKQMVANRWIQLVAADPVTGSISEQNGADGTISFVDYEPENESIAVAASSESWFRGRRDNLAPARILAGLRLQSRGNPGHRPERPSRSPRSSRPEVS